MTPRSARRLVALCAAALLGTLPRPVAGQEAYSAAFVPSGHWSIEAVRRLAALGHAPPGTDPARRVMTQAEAARILEYAADQAEGTPIGPTARGYVRLFRSEFAIPEPREWFHHTRGSSLTLSYEDARSPLATGWGYEDGHPYGDWNGAVAVVDRAGAALQTALQITPFGSVGARASARLDEGEIRLVDATMTATVGSVAAWAGRRAQQWSPGPRYGLIASGATFDGAGLQTTSAFRLPWVLRHAGPIHAEMVVGRHDFQHSCHDPNQPGEAPPCEDAWFLATRGVVTPHPRLSLGVTRAAFFGGAGNTDIDPFAIFSVLIGKHAGEVSELDNQVVSVDVGYRVPVPVVPVRAYIEWGFEDSAGAWTNVPGIVAGVEVPALPFLPGAELAFERTSFAESCCDNPIWYRHSVFQDGWTVDSRPLGHPLGGEGTEWAVSGRYHGADARFRVEMEGYRRQRGAENLFAELGQGKSNGGRLAVALMPARWLEISGAAEIEDGQDWRESLFSIGLRAIP